MTRNLLLSLLGLAAVVTTVYWAGLTGPFLLDDVNNLRMAMVGPFTWESAWDAATRNYSGLIGRPLSALSFAAHYWLGLGDSGWPFKLVNLVLHVLAGLAAYLWAMATLQLIFPSMKEEDRQLAALGCAALWLLHPLQVSATLYVVQRMAILCALFLFLAMACAAALLDGNRACRSRLRALAGFLVCAGLSFLAKENAATIPLLCLGLAAACVSAGQPIDRNGRQFLTLAAAVPIVLGSIYLFGLSDIVTAGYASRPFDVWDRLATQSVALWFYIGLTLLPNPNWMGLFHDWFPVFKWNDWEPWLASAGWLALLTAAVRWRRNQPLLLLAVAWFLGAHAMESSVLPLEMVFEHRNYPALAGIALAISTALVKLHRRDPERIGATPLLLLVALATLTGYRSYTWSSADLFYYHEFRNHPTSFRALQGEIGRLKLAGAPEAVVLPLEETLISRRRDRVWTELLRAERTCFAGRHSFNWSALNHRILRGDSLASFTENSAYLLDRILGDRCPDIDRKAFAGTLETVFERLLSEGKLRPAETAGNQAAWTYRSMGDMENAKLWYRRAAEAYPRGFQPLFNLAYIYLNEGNAEAVASIIEELRHREPVARESIGYRIQELEDHLSTLRASLTVEQ